MLDTNSVGIWNNSVYSRTKKKTMKRSQLVKVIKEELGRKQTLNENLDAIITKYIETDDATELKAYFKSLPDRARTKLAKIFKIELDEEVGYSKYAPGGITKGGTTADFTTILTNLVKGDDQITRGNTSIDKGDPQKRNDILDRGNPDIPLDEAEGQLYSKDDAIAYIENNRGAKYYNIGVSQGTTQRATDPARAIEIVRDSPISQFNLTTYGQTIQFSAPYDEKHGAAVRAMGGLD